VSTHAATTEPVTEPRPPSTTITTTSMERMNVNIRGVARRMACAMRPPASPA
jgi:hypothetical protein